MSHPMFEQHRKTLESACSAIRERGYWSAYPEVPSGKIYGESAKDEGLANFQARLNKPFALEGQPGEVGRVGHEKSPYGPALGVTYPKSDLDALLRASQHAMTGWRDASVEARVGVCLEILHRLNRRSFELANAVMHTTGQGFMMAFQAGGPHAQDRGLEAVAYAYDEMKRTPETATWRKQVGKEEFVTLEKRYRIMPRGVALEIGCSTFPTWNGYPGIFASLATGNAVVVKPHPGAILPLAITIEIARDVIKEAGFDPNIITLLADSHDAPITKDVAIRPEVRIIDYTGGSEFGSWLEKNATQAVVFTEKAGVNTIILDSCDDLKAVTGNLAFSLCLYSGQMCTTPQNIFIPKDGIKVGGEQKSFDDVVGAIVKAVDWMVSDPRRATEVLGAIQNERTAARIGQSAGEGAEILREAQPITNEAFPDARVFTPQILNTDAGHKDLFMREMFGPITYIIATDNTEQSIRLAAEASKTCGAITAGIYSKDASVLDKAVDALAEAGPAISCNLTGQIFVNQAAAYSDFHVSSANPAGNATLCDGAFVARRFSVVQSRVCV
ncbi:MAG: phenylacetic acid degradation protein PaaN [Phycisphaerales bacterium]|nr:phenylacetic acid degradation protein PaaN [Phycisphaerales bacterium]